MSHNHLFSYSVPARPPSPTAGPPQAQPHLSDDNSPSSASPSSSNRPNTAHQGSSVFQFSVPPTTNPQDGSPDSSHHDSSRPGTSIANGAHKQGWPASNGLSGAAGAAARSLLGLADSGGYSSHNTRPMTAPGAGFHFGHNHGYDYTTASAGLFGDALAQNRPPGPVAESSTAGMGGHAGAGTLGLPYGGDGPGSLRNRQASLPELAQPQVPGGLAATSLFAPLYRPQTHAGTSAPFGFGPSEHPWSNHGSRPDTAVSMAGYPGPGPVAMYPGAVMPSVLAAPGTDLQALGMPSGIYGMGMGGGGYPPAFAGAPRKRARRRFDEIERLYQCSYPGCTKSYGTLNHLNAHITMQKHGPKRLPSEFKEIRKEWRAKKKAEAEARKASGQNATQGHGSATEGSTSSPATGQFTFAANPGAGGGILPPTRMHGSMPSHMTPFGPAFPPPYATHTATFRPATAPGPESGHPFTLATAPRVGSSHGVYGQPGPPGSAVGGGYPVAASVAAGGGEFAYRPSSNHSHAPNGWGYPMGSQAVDA